MEYNQLTFRPFSILRKALFPVVLLFIIGFIFSNVVDMKSFLNNLDKIPASIYATVLGLSLCSYNLRALRWLILIRTQESHLSWQNHFLIYFSGFALTTSPGKVGELLRSTYLYKHNVSVYHSLLCFITERIWDVMVVFLLALLYLYQYLSPLLTVILSLLPIFFILLLQTEVIGFVSSKVKRWHTFQLSLQIFQLLWSIKNCYKTSILSLLAWTCQGIALSIILDALNFSIPLHTAIGIYCLSLLTGALSLIPAGIGATEASISLLLITFGIPNDIAILAALLTRMLTLWFAIVLGLVSLFTLERQTS